MPYLIESQQITESPQTVKTKTDRIYENTIVDTKFRLKKWSMLSVDYYKNFDKIILNSTYNSLKF